MALGRQGGRERLSSTLPGAVLAADGLFAGEVGDNPACAHDSGLTWGDVVWSDGLADLVGLGVGVAGGEGDVYQLQQVEVDAGGHVPGLGLGFGDVAGNRKWLVVVVRDGPGTSRAVKVGAVDLDGLTGITWVGALCANGGWGGGAEVLLRECGGRLGDKASAECKGAGSEYGTSNGAGHDVSP